MEYALETLPDAIRAAYARRAATEHIASQDGKLAASGIAVAERVEAGAAAAARDAGDAAFLLRDPQSRRRAEDRLAVLTACNAYVAASPLPRRQAHGAFAAAYNAGAIALGSTIANSIARLCARTLYDWRRRVEQGGLDALTDARGRHRRGSGKIDAQPALHAFLTALLQQKSHIRAGAAAKAMRARFEGEAIALPSYRALQRWMAAWRLENAEALAAISNPDKWKSTHMAAFGSRSEDISRLNQRWELDSTPADVMLADGRHAIVGAIDVYSRRLKLLVAPTSRATAVAALLRRAILAWGVPEEIKTDNGSDYVSRHVTRAAAALDIQHTRCQPFSGWEKPHIERALRTFNHGVVELLDGFIGHNVAERQTIEARKSFADRLMKRGAVVPLTMTAADLQKFCDDWTENLYQHDVHSSLGETPFTRAAGYAGARRVIENERALDILLAEAPGDGGGRTVTKNGLRIDNREYIAPELALHVGRRVQVMYDESDIGRVFVYANSGFVCVAECPSITGIDRKTVAEEATRRQQHKMKQVCAEARVAAKRERIADVAEEIMASAARQNASLTALTRNQTPHRSAGLASATAAAAALDRHEPPPLTPAQEVIQDRVVADLAVHRAAKPKTEIEMKQDRFARARAVEAGIAAGAPVDPEEARWLGGYQATAEYRAQKRMLENLGLAEQA